MVDISLANIEFIKIPATSDDATILRTGMNNATRGILDDQIGMILREYYYENTMNTQLIELKIPKIRYR